MSTVLEVFELLPPAGTNKNSVLRHFHIGFTLPGPLSVVSNQDAG